jgi:hypothetical protein
MKKVPLLLLATIAVVFTGRAQAQTAPTIATQPCDQTVPLGGSAAFSVGTTDVGDTYQWQFDGVNIPGATTATLTITGVAPQNTGQYDVVLTNGNGSTTSSVATLYIEDPLATGLNWLIGSNDGYFQNGRLELVASENGGFQAIPSTGGNAGPALNGVSTVLMGTLDADWSIQVDVHGGAIPVAAAEGYNAYIQIFNMQSALDNGQFYYGYQFGLAYNEDGQNGIAPLGSIDNINWNSGLYSSAPTSNTDFSLRATYSSGTHLLSTYVSTGGGTTWTPQQSFDVTQPSSAGGWSMTDAPGTWFGVCLNAAALLGPINSGDVYFSNFVFSGLQPGMWAPTSAAISSQPSPQNLYAGTTATFNVSAVGYGSLTYQWYLDGTALSDGVLSDGSVVSGSSTSTLNISNLQGDENGSSLFVYVSNPIGGDESIPVTLDVVTLPTIAMQPQSVVVPYGGTATFSVASNDPADTYQWQFQGADIPGQIGATLIVPSVSTASTGEYDVVLTDPIGATASSVTTLSILDPLSSGANWAEDSNAAGGADFLAFQGGSLQFTSSGGTSSEFVQAIPVPGGNFQPMVYGPGGSEGPVGSVQQDWSVQVEIHASTGAVPAGQSYDAALTASGLQDSYYDDGLYVYLVNDPNTGGYDISSFGYIGSGSLPYASYPLPSGDVIAQISYSSSTQTISTSYSTDGGNTWQALISFSVTASNADGGWGAAGTSRVDQTAPSSPQGHCISRTSSMMA